MDPRSIEIKEYSVVSFVKEQEKEERSEIILKIG
jgi:hypothetical protein